MNIHDRILAALNWQEPDQIPLTTYNWFIPRGEKERLLRESGVGIVLRPAAHKVVHRQVEITTREFWKDGRKFVRKTLHTPVGEVYKTLEPESAYDTSSWIKEYYIKKPDDYKVMEFVYKDAIYQDNHDYIREAVRQIGADGLVYVRIAKVPIQEMLYQLMGFERFSIDYHERRDLFDSLHNCMLERYEELFELAIDAPVEILLFGDNITSDVVGNERFRNYCMPIYQRLHHRLSGTGKKLAVHMDGRLASLKQAISEASFDIIEALTPPPMGDVSIKEARKIWADKALWINFTSSVHIEPPQAIEAHTRQLVEEAGSKKGFAIGITEDAPVEALERSLEVISRVLQDYR
ncbi:MAG: hypothetical protein JRH18_21195 [Deltaproteobacteria bacterium]|nr:hypothetical protein [Deltaproteobacteria bacterium]MBW1996005.1 hypothetical protein [Deltaproteobacteria bacterium]MBW2154169.1 hypothetical protein [Deltaproteobacteria bacterium]